MDPVGPLAAELDEPGAVLCLSGGGYRAMLFHLGTLWRLNELGRLRELRRVSSVSGGSITAAVLGLRWRQLRWDREDRAENLVAEVVEPIRGLARHTLDVPAVLAGLALPGLTISGALQRAYDRRLFHGARVQDLGGGEGPAPLFVLNATNLQSGALWRFTQFYSRDYKVGRTEAPIPLAAAVAASSAFPPVLGPARLRLRDSDYSPGSGQGLQRPPFTTRPTLLDGGVYDNLGLQAAERAGTVYVSDGGGAFVELPGKLGPLRGWRWRDWGSQSVRVLQTIDNQVRSLRKHDAIRRFRPGAADHRDGAYWGIRSEVADYGLEDPLEFAPLRAEALAATPTRLAKLSDPAQIGLIQWGYVICDTAMRRWVVKEAPRPPKLPYADP